MRALLFFVAFNFVAPSGFGVTLEEYLNDVFKENPSFLSTKKTVESFKYKIDPAGSFEDPFIAVGMDEIPFEGSMGSVKRYQISQTFPFPGKSGSRKRSAALQAESVESDSQIFERQLKIISTQVFFKSLINQKNIELNKELRNLLTTVSESLKARYKSGGASHHEFILSEVELSILEVDKLRLLREQKSLFASFNELRNQPPNREIEKLEVPKFIKEDLSKKEAFENQPEFKVARTSLEQSQEEIKQARLSYFPDIVLQGMMMEPADSMSEQHKNWGFMVGISVPLYFWNKQSDQLKSARAQKQAVEFQQRALNNRLNAEWIEAQEQLKINEDLVELYKKSVLPVTRLAAQNARSGYASRKLALKQYVDTLKVQQTQEVEYLTTQVDLYLAQLRMKELLSNPPVLQFSSKRPTLFGDSGMSDSSMNSMTSSPVNMGGAMKAPSGNKTKPNTNNSSGMEGM